MESDTSYKIPRTMFKYEDTTKVSNFSVTETEQIKLYPTIGGIADSLHPTTLYEINDFWLKFDPPSSKAHYTFATIYLLIMIFGCSGNGLVIFMLIRYRSLRTSANVLVTNLAVSDFLMLIKSPIAIYNGFHKGPALGDIGCRLYGFMGGLSGVASIATLTSISLDRYIVVKYPLDLQLKSTSPRAIIIVICIWTYSFIFAVIPALNIGLSRYTPEGYLTTCSFDYLSKSLPSRIFIFVFFIAAWVIPFFIMTYCYIYIIKAVFKANRIQSNKNKHKMETKLTLIVIFIVTFWFLAWTPYAIIALLGISGYDDKITPLSTMIPAIFCKTSACFDPYIYAITHPKFRREFNRLFRDTAPKRSTNLSYQY